MTGQGSTSRTAGTERVQGEYILRFDIHQRIQHFLLASAFITLVLTGFPQKFPDVALSAWWVDTLGGLRVVRSIHRGAGFVMLAACAYHLAWLFVRIGVQRRYGAFRMVPTLQDGRDAVQMFRYYLGFASERPKFGRFSYLEKFDYWAVFWGMAMIGTSGVVLTFAVTATGVIPGDALPLLKGIHSDEAVLAVSWIAIVHMFNAHLAPWVFPFNPTIFTGKLSRTRYAEDHPLEYAEIMSGLEPVERVSEPEGEDPIVAWHEAAGAEPDESEEPLHYADEHRLEYAEIMSSLGPPEAAAVEDAEEIVSSPEPAERVSEPEPETAMEPRPEAAAVEPDEPGEPLQRESVPDAGEQPNGSGRNGRGDVT